MKFYTQRNEQEDSSHANIRSNSKPRTMNACLEESKATSVHISCSGSLVTRMDALALVFSAFAGLYSPAASNGCTGVACNRVKTSGLAALAWDSQLAPAVWPRMRIVSGSANDERFCRCRTSCFDLALIMGWNESCGGTGVAAHRQSVRYDSALLFAGNKRTSSRTENSLLHVGLQPATFYELGINLRCN